MFNKLWLHTVEERLLQGANKTEINVQVDQGTMIRSGNEEDALCFIKCLKGLNQVYVMICIISSL